MYILNYTRGLINAMLAVDGKQKTIPEVMQYPCYATNLQ